MTVRYEGKSPGKLWYTWQKTKGIFATRQHMPLAKNSAGTGLSATGTVLVQQQLATVLAYLPLAVGGLAAMAAYNAFRAVRPAESDKKNKISTGDRWMSAAKYGGAALLVGVLTPTAATWAGFALIGATGYFGWRSFQNWKAAAGTTAVKNYVRGKEADWLERKQAGTLRQRLARRIGNAVKGFRLGALKTGKWAGIAAAGAGLLATAAGVAQYLGAAIVPAATAAGAMNSVAALGAAIGLAAPVVLYGAAALVAAAIPVGIAAGLICHHKIREIKAAGAEAPAKPRFFKRPSADAEEAAAASKLSNDNAPKAKAGFNAEAGAAAPDKTETPKPAAQAPEPEPAPEPEEALSEARKAAAEARRRNKRSRDKKFG